MPRYAPYQLRWSEQAQTYFLCVGDQESHQTLASDWLEQITSFSFHSRAGVHYTARKQRVQRGSSYWYAYRRLNGRIVKRYLGRTTDLTLGRLEEIALQLQGLSTGLQASLQPPPETSFPQLALRVVPSEGALHASPVGFPPLLLSKLSPPRLHASLLDRPRLFGLLDAAQEYPLTLLSAPAGFGKTTLVCQWLVARRASSEFPPVAWLSLETSDNDLARFWRYLIAACRAFQVDLQEAHSALTSTISQPPFWPSSLEAALTILLNAQAQNPAGGFLILEDYHVITEHSIHATLSFFLDHLPPNIHVIMITRRDPPFSLTRLRARNDLCEVRTADLRFSLEETTILLQQSLPFMLPAETIQRLYTRIEGWGAGLHLVRLALQKLTTPMEGEQTLALLTGSNASLEEYFVSEVLYLQSEAVQQFVLQTSILPRLTGSLCDALLERRDSQDMLATLERSNLFLEPLDTAGSWYRYHALFAEAMRNEARRRIGVDQLHRLSARASRWYAAHSFLSEAIDAALEAQDYMRAAIWIEGSIQEHTFPGEIHEPHTLYRWLEQFPVVTLEQHPVLCLSYAAALLFKSTSWLPDVKTLHEVEMLLYNAECRLREEHNLPRLGELFAFRSLLALRQGAAQAAIRYAQQALDWLAPAQHIWRGITLCVVAEEWLGTGHFSQARAALLEARTLCEAVKNRHFQRIATLKLAQVYIEQGEFRQASSLYRQVLASAREEGPVFALCNTLVGMAACCYESNELESAYQYAQEAMKISQRHQLMFSEVRATLILARVQYAQDQTLVAQQQLADLLEKVPSSLPNLLQEVQAAQARLALAVGDHVTVQRWATGREPQPDFSQEIEEELLLIRWLRAQGKLEEASCQLERLLSATRQMEHTRRMLEIQVEMVLVYAARQQKAESQRLLREVLVQAFAGNCMRLFLDAGDQMEILLRSLIPQARDQALLAYIRALLGAFPARQQDGLQEQAVSLVEPLSAQEMRVLRLLVQHRSNAEIANELVVSINTVRTQVQSIYRKLGVHKRSAVGEIARELRLIS